MFSSEKFLSPIVTAGLPTPGPLAAGLLAAVLAVVVLVLFDAELLELPHPATPRLIAHVAASAVTRIDSALRPVNRLIIEFASWGQLSSLSIIFIINILSRRERRRVLDRADGGVASPLVLQAQAARRERVLCERERALDGERERRHADSGTEYAVEVVAGLVRDR